MGGHAKMVGTWVFHLGLKQEGFLLTVGVLCENLKRALRLEEITVGLALGFLLVLILQMNTPAPLG